MFYKSSDPTTSTSDWFKLNVDQIPTSLLTRGLDVDDPAFREVREDNDGIEIPDWNVEPDETDDSGERGVRLFREPDRDMYDSDEEYQGDLVNWRTYDAAAREAHEAREGVETYPTWGWCWEVESGIEEHARAVGLRVFEHDDVQGAILGADSGGHSFYEAYWIPLRARIIASNEYNTAEDRRAMFDVLAEEYRREGGKPEVIAKILGIEI